MPRWSKRATFKETLGPAMEITDREEAKTYFNDLVEHLMSKSGRTREDAEEVTRRNLGYYAGYYNTETRKRVEDLFCSPHPLFGPVTG